MDRFVSRQRVNTLCHQSGAFVAAEDHALFVLHLKNGQRMCWWWPGTVWTLFSQLKSLIYVLLVQWKSMAIKTVSVISYSCQRGRQGQM